MPLLETNGIQKTYRSPDGGVQTVLDVEHFALEPGEQVGVMGSSGSGKTTFLNVVAGILRPDRGSVLFEDVDLSALGESARDRFRARKMGYVFQSFHLLEGYTALENVQLGMLFGPGPDTPFARELLDELGMSDRVNHRPSQLSVGQRQRVALARALANRPRLVLADEPTGNLDRDRAAGALRLVRELCTTHEAALLLVSHDPAILEGFERVVRFADLNRAAHTEEPA